VNATKLSNVLDEVKEELVARVRSAEESATYGVTEMLIPKTERSSSSEFENRVVS